MHNPTQPLPAGAYDLLLAHHHLKENERRQVLALGLRAHADRLLPRGDAKVVLSAEDALRLVKDLIAASEEIGR